MKIQFKTYVNEDLLKVVKLEAVNQDIPYSMVVELALIEWLNNNTTLPHNRYTKPEKEI